MHMCERFYQYHQPQSMPPFPHFQSCNLSLFVGTMFCRKFQFPFGISHRIGNSHEFFFLFPLISFRAEVLPDKVINLHIVLSTQNMLYFSTRVICQLFEIIWQRTTILYLLDSNNRSGEAKTMT